MTLKQKPTRLFVNNRVQMVNDVLMGLFAPTLNTLRADIQVTAQSIASAHAKRYIDSKPGEVASMVPMQFKYLAGGDALSLLVQPIIRTRAHLDTRVVSVYGVLMTHANRDHFNRWVGDATVVMGVQGMNPLTMTPDEQVQIDALTQRVTDLEASLLRVRRELVDAVAPELTKTVGEFLNRFPRYAHFVTLPEFKQAA